VLGGWWGGGWERGREGGSGGVGEDLFFLKKKEFFNKKTFTNCFFSKFVRKVVWGWIITRGISQIWLQVTYEMKVEKIRIKKGTSKGINDF
jgi:hypothetical protein